jgi:hypothetical protein
MGFGVVSASMAARRAPKGSSSLWKNYRRFCFVQGPPLMKSF